MTEAEILAEYPTLTVEGIRAAAAYGAAPGQRGRAPLSPRVGIRGDENILGHMISTGRRS